jgi:hypothetical protein
MNGTRSPSLPDRWRLPTVIDAGDACKLGMEEELTDRRRLKSVEAHHQLLGRFLFSVGKFSVERVC